MDTAAAASPLPPSDKGNQSRRFRRRNSRSPLTFFLTEPLSHPPAGDREKQCQQAAFFLRTSQADAVARTAAADTATGQASPVLGLFSASIAFSAFVTLE